MVYNFIDMNLGLQCFVGQQKEETGEDALCNDSKIDFLSHTPIQDVITVLIHCTLQYKYAQQGQQMPYCELKGIVPRDLGMFFFIR
jgi:hypothetical protein